MEIVVVAVIADSWFGGLGGWFVELVVDGCCMSSM